MKITKQRLKEIIREELVTEEAGQDRELEAFIEFVHDNRLSMEDLAAIQNHVAMLLKDPKLPAT
jgi:hypothetical protein